MSDVAKAAGVSKNAVSLALRNSPQIPEVTRARIRGIANRLGYVRNPVVGELFSQMLKSASSPHRSTIGMINMNKDPEAFTQHPTIPTYVAGCRDRARELGYSLDSFWLHDPDISGRRLLQILQTRNIRGLLLIGLMKENRIPAHFAPIIEHFPCVVTGLRTHDPALPFVCVDHHRLSLTAMEQALSLGYQRPGLVLDPVIDELIEGRFSAGFLTGQQALPKRRRLPPLYTEEAGANPPQEFRIWFERHQPDVLFALYNNVRHWLEALDLSIPGQIGLIQLEWREDRPDWAGMNQHNDIAGRTAIDMLISRIHHGERGAPAFPTGTLIGASWVEGRTVRR